MAYPRVLLVDDDTHMLVELVRVLTKQCHMRVLVASSATQALQYLDADVPFSLIVADYHLPGMNGTTLLSICIERWPNMKRAIYTGDSTIIEPFAHAVIVKGGPPGEAAATICELAGAT